MRDQDGPGWTRPVFCTTLHLIRDFLGALVTSHEDVLSETRTCDLSQLAASHFSADRQNSDVDPGLAKPSLLTMRSASKL